MCLVISDFYYDFSYDFSQLITKESGKNVVAVFFPKRRLSLFIANPT